MPTPVDFPRFAALPFELRLKIWHHHFNWRRLHMVRPEDGVFDPHFPGLLRLNCDTIELTPSHINREARDVCLEGCVNVNIASDILRRTVISQHGGFEQLRKHFPDSADFLEALTPSPVNWDTDIIFLCLPDDTALYRRLSAVPWARNIKHLAVECGTPALTTWLANVDATRSVQIRHSSQETDSQLKERVDHMSSTIVTAGLKQFTNLLEFHLITTPSLAVRTDAEEIGLGETGFVPIDIDSAIDHTGPQWYFGLDEQFIRMLDLHRSSVQYLERPLILKAGLNVNFLLPVELSRMHPDQY